MATRTVNGFKIQSQHPHKNLCWAAVALSVDIWRAQPGHWNSLCQVTSETPSLQLSPPCDRPGFIHEALDVHRLRNGLARLPSWDLVKNEIENQRVVCASILWNGGGAHEVVVSGYFEDTSAGTREVMVLDPNKPKDESRIPFDSFLHNSEGRCYQLTKVK